MCGCVRHYEQAGLCTCDCPEHDHLPKTENAKFDFSINLYDISPELVSKIRREVESLAGPLNDVSYTATVIKEDG